MDGHEQFATGASGARFPVGRFGGEETSFADDLQYGIYDPNSLLYEVNDPLGYRTRITSQLITTHADVTGTHDPQSKAPEAYASKKRKL